MAGPFTSYAPPGVYTRTILDPAVVALIGNLRIPAVIGTGEERLRVDDFQMIRGSSNLVDLQRLNEDVSDQLDGTNNRFTTRFRPIVTGQNSGTTTTNPNDVEVFINGKKTAVLQVQGEFGLVIMQTIPFEDDIVTITYHYILKDTRVEEEDVSNQFDRNVGGLGISTLGSPIPGVSEPTPDPHTHTVILDINGNGTTSVGPDGHFHEVSENTVGFSIDPDTLIPISESHTHEIVSRSFNNNKVIHTDNSPIVDGTNGGRTTAVPTDVQVTVNGDPVRVIEMDGFIGAVTLRDAPAATDEVRISYFFNEFNNTCDDLPFPDPVETVRVGIAPGRLDFEEGVDFVIVGNQICWGNASVIKSQLHTPGFEFFDDTQIQTTLVDERIHKEDLSAQIRPGNNIFEVKFQPIVNGDGRGTVTGDSTTVVVTVNGAGVSVVRVDGREGKVFLDVVPIPGDEVLVSYWRNVIADDVYDLEVIDSGGAGVGKYTVTSLDLGPIGRADVVPASFTGFDVPLFLAAGGEVFFRTGPIAGKGFAVDEFVRITFTAGERFVVESFEDSFLTTPKVGGSGTGLVNTGRANSTYIDAVTGLQFTINTIGDPVVPATGGIIPGAEFVMQVVAQGEFIAGTKFQRQIPGIVFTVSDTREINERIGDSPGDKARISTFKREGEEPAVSDFYYVTYFFEKKDFSCKLLTQFKDVVEEYGELKPQNHLTLASFLMFLNGAVALLLCQVKRQPGLGVAAPFSFIEVLDELRKPQEFGIKPNLIQPLTTDDTVLTATLKHNIIMSSERFRGERITFFGVPVGTEPNEAAEKALSFRNERMIMVYPDGAVVGLLDEEGTEIESVVGGEFVAAALVGVNVSPSVDVATPMTRKVIAGFKRLFRRMDETTMDLVANSGVTIIEDTNPVLRVRHGLTTDMTGALTREISIITVKDFVQQSMRFALEQFIGRKFLNRVKNDIAIAANSVMTQLIQREIITATTSATVVQDRSDPTMALVDLAYSPVFPLNYIRVTFNLRGRL